MKMPAIFLVIAFFNPLTQGLQLELERRSGAYLSLFDAMN